MKKNCCLLFFNLLIYSLASSQCTPTLFKDGINSFGRAEVNNTLLLFTYEGVWKSDGTPNGTQLINGSPRINNGAFGFATLNNVVYFSAYSPSYNVSDLWKTDGTEAGTVLVVSIPDAIKIYDFAVAQNKLFFVVEKGFGNNKIWTSDGTAAGTSQLIDLDPTNDINTVPKQLISFNDHVYFWAGSNYFQHYYKTDGTAAGTIILNDIGDEYGYNIGGLSTVSNGKLFYFTGSNSDNTGLWSTDGTIAGTQLVKPLSDAGDFLDVNGTLYFSATDEGGLTGQTLYGDEPWISDGTTQGTTIIKDINPGYISSCYTSRFIQAGNKVYFGATDGIHGTEVWQTDGTEAGTGLLKDIYTGTNSGATNFGNAINYNGYLYFGARDEIHGQELWKTDGTSIGTELVADLYPGTEDSGPYDFFIFKGMLFFETYGNFEKKLWYCGDASSSIQEEKGPKLGLFPNPTTGIIQLNSEKELNGSITVYNASGIKVKTFSGNKLEKATLDFSSFPKGLYCVQVNTETIEKQIKFILE